MRRLDEVVIRLDRLSAALEEGYVRKDVQEARELGTGIQLKGFEDELHLQGKEIEKVNGRIDAISAQRDRERDERDKQRAADRRLIYTLAVTTIVGPVLV